MNQIVRRSLSAILAAAFLLLAVGCGSKGDTIPVESSAAPAVSEPEYEIVREFQIEKVTEAQKRNPDILGWLHLPNTTVDDPVLQAENNEYYLRLTDEKKYDIFGCYFADFRNTLEGRDSLDRNTIIYGHSDYTDDPEAKGGKKFTQLFHYADMEFLKENPYIFFSTEKEDFVYQIFSVFYTDIDFNYIQNNPSDANYGNILDEALAKSLYVMDVPVTLEDKIITLSTCTGQYKQPKENYRFVVMGRLMPSNEAPLIPFDIKENPNPIG